MAKTEKSKPTDYDSLIDDLIQKIDNEKSLFKVKDYLNGLSSFILTTLLIVFIIFLIGYISSINVSDKIVILLLG